MVKGKRFNLKQILLLQSVVLMYSFSAVLIKLAAQQPFLSQSFIPLYGGAILIMLLYAIAWQQFLKIIPLTTAYGNREVSVIWSMVFGAAFFGETITWNMVVGALAIMFGLYLVVTADV